MGKPAITTEKWLEIGSGNNFDDAERLFAAFDNQSILECGEARWGRDFGKHGFMHSTDHRSALVKINGKEPTWLEVYDSWSAGDAIPTQARLMEPDDGSLTYCLIRFYKSMARGLQEWNSILTTGKLRGGRPVMGECASRVGGGGGGTGETGETGIKLSARSLETLRMLPMNGLQIGPGRAARLQMLREEIEKQKAKLSPRSAETVGLLPMNGLKIGPGRAARLQLLREEIEKQLKP
ncbi:MAG: hypothetical protein ABUT39_19770 [Acidobacteriota bacterium]